MRWSIVLNSPALIAKPWRGQLTPESHADSVVLRLGPDPEGRRATLAVEAGAAGLQLAVLAEGRANGFRPAYPEWYNREHLVVFLNPGHDHATRWLYAVDDEGKTIQEAAWMAPGEEPGDCPSRELPQPPPAQGEFRRLGEGGYWARLALPHSRALWPEGMPLGLRVKVGFHEEVIPRPLAWPAQPVWAQDLPLSYGDMFTQEPAVAVQSLEFREPAWGGVPSQVVLRMVIAPSGPRKGRVDIATILPGDSEQVQPSLSWEASSSGMTEVPLPVVFPPRAKWASDVCLTARLQLALRDADGRVLWAAQYPFGFDCGIIVRERYGASSAALPPRPAPSAHDFLDRQRAFLLARLPDYRRRTTRQGAPSDFYLEDAQGEEHLDLMAPNALDLVAAMLAQRFNDWQDALAAAALWTYHPCVTRHSSRWSALASQAATDTVPRLGGCFCGDVARLLATLAEKIGQRFGLPLVGYTLGLRGHLATMVETPIGRVVLDGMLGQWYPALDNTRLATLDEMRACREIVQRLWYCPRAHGHEFYFAVHDQIIQRWQEGQLHFPSGTPAPGEEIG